MIQSDPKPPANDDDRYQTDTFSRSDAEGAPAEDPGGPDELAQDERPIEAGAEGGYQTDAFSRNDEEGVPQEDLRKPPTNPASGAPPHPEAAPQGQHLKAADDADSRDAAPMKGPEGGVR
ncbi:MAG TPA: hypothetical protein VN694_16480 [Caulobacteraceae bacterium]|nr:hypothetical protein [Caulobacteraceae bacterium]